MSSYCERCEQHLSLCKCTVYDTASAADLFAAFLTVEARQTRRKAIRWTCRLCQLQGYDGPGLETFWAHWDALHERPRLPMRINL